MEKRFDDAKHAKGADTAVTKVFLLGVILPEANARNFVSFPSLEKQVRHEKQVLILGSLGSGTLQMSAALAKLGVEVRESRCVG